MSDESNAKTSLLSPHRQSTNSMKYIFQKILSSLRQDVQVLILVNKESYCKKKKISQKNPRKVNILSIYL